MVINLNTFILLKLIFISLLFLSERCVVLFWRFDFCVVCFSHARADYSKFCDFVGQLPALLKKSECLVDVYKDSWQFV